MKIAIIGCGRISQRHAEYIEKYAKLAAVCDIKKERADELANKYNVKAFYGVDELLNSDVEIDLVSVCSPNGFHKEHTVKSLKSGRHVLVEKPMAIKIRDCEQMIKTAEDMNKRLFVVKQNRFNPPVEAVKRLLDNNRLGKIFSIQLNCFWNRNEDYYKNSDWKGTKLLDGGTLFTQFSHFIDLLYWLFGDIDEVDSYLNNANHRGIIDFEDTGVVIARFDCGILATINYTINSFRKNMEGSLTIFGEKGTVKIGGQYLNILEYQEIENYRVENIPESGPANNYGSYQGSMSNHDKVYENVIDVLTNGGTITTNFMDGLKTVQIIEKIYYKGSSNG